MTDMAASVSVLPCHRLALERRSSTPAATSTTTIIAAAIGGCYAPVYNNNVSHHSGEQRELTATMSR
jgi:hypothetical protein